MQRTSIQSSLSLLERRGPDSQGLCNLDEKCTFGATRLALTDDHPRSNQPFRDKNYMFVFNGQIYNFNQIRKVLLPHISFDTEGDTEVLFQLLKNNSLDGLVSLNGMFAFAFYDKSNKMLLIGRDSLGKKPLYFVQNRESLYFASTIRALSNFSTNTISPEGIINYLHLGFQVCRQTVISDIESVQPGQTLEVTLSKEQSIQIVSQVFKDIEFENVKTKKSLQNTSKKVQYSGRLRNAVIQAVEVRLEGHDHVALALSGGVDSSLIALVMRLLGKKVNCYSVSWADADKKRYNFDAEGARIVAKELGHEFKKVTSEVSRNLLLEVDLFLGIMGQPNNNPTGLSMLKLYKTIHEDGLRITFTGDGADEYFYGYDRYVSLERLQRLWQALPFSAKFLESLSNFRSENVSRVLVSNYLGWSSWHQTFSISELISLFNFKSVNVDNYLESGKGLFEQIANGIPKENIVQRMSKLDRKIWLSNESNLKLDHISMHFSIEARSPFQDRDLIELALEVPQFKSNKILNKSLLYEAFPELNNLPIAKKKMGFVSPIGNWLRQNESLVDKQIRFLNEKDFLKATWETSVMVNSGNFVNLRKTWTLFVLARWLHNLENQGVAH